MSSSAQQDLDKTADSSRTRQRDPTSKPRRYHNKSRSGCLNCKRRRIKCGEERPECRKCWEKALDCVYPAAIAPIGNASHPAFSWTSLSETHSLPNVGDIKREGPETSTSEHSSSMSIDADHLLEHFATYRGGPWIGDSLLQDGMQRFVVQASKTRPYLYHAALSMSAAHLSYRAPTEAKYQHLAVLHYQQSLHMYCKYLRHEIHARDADAMFATCVLLAMITFTHLNEPEDQVEYGVSRGWVRAMQGTKFLLDTPEYYTTLRAGIWGAVLQKYNDLDDPIAAKYLDSSPRCAEELLTIKTLEDVARSTDEERQKAYSAGLFILQDLVQLKPTPELIGRFAFHLTRLPHNFYALVDSGDIPALAIAGFWCALFSRVDSWWITAPAKIECNRIAAELSDCHDERLIKVILLLKACGSNE